MTEIIKMMKNIKHLFICHAFLFCSLIFAEWDGISISEPSTSIIDDVQYYEIDSPEELAWFAQQVNSQETRINAILKVDINLNMQQWRPIGDSTTTGFNGIFDGNGYKISGLNVSNQRYAGLFGVLDSGTIKNLTIENSIITADETGLAGGIVGLAEKFSHMENIVNKAEIESNTHKSAQAIGGIAGECLGFLQNAKNEGNVTNPFSTGYVGGICGTLVGDNIKQDNILENSGTIYGGAYTGGISGLTGYITNATNKGSVFGYKNIGGISGLNGSISHSKNYGIIQNINVSENSQYIIHAGGICGHKCAVIQNSENYGDIMIKSDSTIYVGGITGSSTYSIDKSGNHGNLNVSSGTNAYLGGISGEFNYEQFSKLGMFFSNVYNQGRLSSSHYAAGIIPLTHPEGLTIKNFYVATDSINAPNAAGFTNYNSESSTINNGYLDSTFLQNIPLIEENIGVTEKLYNKSTNQLQHDSMAYILDVPDRSQINEVFYSSYTTHWSRGNKYPVFEDSLHNPIYKVLFVNKDDSTFLYTDSSSHIKNFPIANGAIWHSWNSYYYMSDMRIIDDNSVFSWSDSLIIATYPNCNDSEISDIGCCMGYFLDLYSKWQNECNRSGGEFAFTNKYYCIDFDSNGTMDGLDSTSYLYSTVQLNKNKLQTCNNAAQSSSSLEGIYSSANAQQSSANESNSSASNSSAHESSEKSSTSSESLSSSSVSILPETSSSTHSTDISSSSKFNDITTIGNTILPPSYEISIIGKQIQIYGLERETPYALFDMQGRILRRGTTLTTKVEINVSNNGSYIIKIKNHIRLVKIK